jgi:hypothetical protein
MAHCTSASFNGRPMRSARRSRQAPPKKVAAFFNLSLVEKRRPRPNRRVGSPDTGDLRNFLAHLRVALLSRQGMAVMAGGEIVVDDKPSTSKSARRTLESMAERAGAKTAKPFPKPAPPKRDPRKRELLEPIGAMSLQRSDGAIHSVPQEFVHLVGCCDPNARPSKAGRPRPAPAKGQLAKAK